MQPKSPRFFGLGGRPRLDVVDGGKVVNENDRMSESLAETQADRPASSRADAPVVSLAETMDATRPGVRTGADKIRSGESLARTMIATGEIAEVGEASEPGLLKTRAAPAEEQASPSLRSRSGDRVEVGLAQTMDLSDPAAQRAASDAMDADLIGLARTRVKADDEDLAAPSRPSLRRDEAITDESGLERRVLAADAEDRRLKELIRARLFRKKAAPVKIDRFTILDRLGEGGMGVVYTAYDDQLDRKVAIKVMRSEGNEGSLGSARLHREAQAMARLSHPNIVTVYEVKPFEDSIYVAMEYIRGKSLDRWLQEPHAWQEILDVFRQAGLGLAAAHRAGLVHRDFKPHNVLLSEDGVAKVLDFGLVRSAGSSEDEPPAGAMVPAETQALSLLEASLTRTGAIMGTPAYMAPEQHLGLVATPKSDLYSFCVALYEGLYTEHPFDCSTLANLIAAVTSGKVKDAPAATKVPVWLRKVILRGMAVDPEQRYPTMQELLVELARDPVARRRRVLASSGAALLVGALGFGAATLGAPAVAACTGADQEIAAAWSDAKKESIKAAILGTGVAYAGETWEKIAPRLDAYASEWAAMRTEACESHRDQKHSDRLFDLRTACLDQRQAGFVGLVDALASADAGVVENAVKAVGSLPLLSTCADTEALTAAIAPPEDPAVAQKVQEIREELARIKVQEDTGRYSEGLESVVPLVDTANALGYAPLVGETVLRRGSLEMVAGMTDAAENSLSSALMTSFAAGDDNVALEALSKRIFLQAYHKGDDVPARAGIEWGEALLTRAGSDPIARGLFLNNAGSVYAYSGDRDHAEQLFKRSVEVRKATLGPNHPDVARTLTNLGVLYSHFADYTAAEQVLTEAHAIAVTTLGEHHPEIGPLNVTMGLAHLGAGHVARAHEAVEAGLATNLAVLDPSSPLLTIALVCTASVDLERRDTASAMSRLRQALDIVERGEGGGALQAVANEWLGRAAGIAGRFDDARAAHERSLSLLGSVDSSDPMALADALDSYGDTLRLAGDLPAALTRYQEALAVRKDKLPPGTASLAITLEHLGATLVDLGRLDDAAAALDEATEVVTKALPPGSQQAAKILRTQSALALARGASETAVTHAREALKIHEATRDADDGELAITRLALARALRAAGHGDEAKELAANAEKILVAGGPGWQREAADAGRFLAAK